VGSEHICKKQTGVNTMCRDNSHRETGRGRRYHNKIDGGNRDRKKMEGEETEEIAAREGGVHGWLKDAGSSSSSDGGDGNMPRNPGDGDGYGGSGDSRCMGGGV